MNNQTKACLIEFITSVENLASACVITTGMETASEIISAAEKLKYALLKDETITEIR